jgi:hypothetical protein
MGWYEFEKLLMESKSLSVSGSMISKTTFVQATVCIVLGLVCLLLAGILIDQDMARLQGWISRLLGG